MPSEACPRRNTCQFSLASRRHQFKEWKTWIELWNAKLTHLNQLRVKTISINTAIQDKHYQFNSRWNQNQKNCNTTTNSWSFEELAQCPNSHTNWCQKIYSVSRCILCNIVMEKRSMVANMPSLLCQTCKDYTGIYLGESNTVIIKLSNGAWWLLLGSNNRIQNVDCGVGKIDGIRTQTSCVRSECPIHQTTKDANLYQSPASTSPL